MDKEKRTTLRKKIRLALVVLAGGRLRDSDYLFLGMANHADKPESQLKIEAADIIANCLDALFMELEAKC